MRDGLNDGIYKHTHLINYEINVKEEEEMPLDK
jgi:hypothetical protein